MTRSKKRGGKKYIAEEKPSWWFFCVARLPSLFRIYTRCTYIIYIIGVDERRMLEGKEIVILLNSRFQRLSSTLRSVSIVNLLHRQLIIGKRKYRIRDEIKRIERTPSVLHLEWNSGKSFYEFIEVSSDGFHRGNYRFFEWNVSIPAKCKQSVYVSQKGVIFK